MALLPEPYEYLDLEHGQSIRLEITSFLPGEAVIHPNNPTPRHIRKHMDQQKLTAPPAPGMPISITEPVLRVFGRRLDQPSQMTYWDISSKRLIADLTPILQRSRGTPIAITLQANGHRPSKRYSVETG